MRSMYSVLPNSYPTKVNASGNILGFVRFAIRTIMEYCHCCVLLCDVEAICAFGLNLAVTIGFCIVRT